MKAQVRRPKSPTVNAYSQQSRFHSATITTLSRDVDLRDVNLTVDNADLLVDSRLQLKAGVHYGLVGRNGTGKSTLLKVIGDHSLVGFPDNLRTLYIAQLDVADSDRSVLETVLAADEERQKRMDDIHGIEAEVQGALDGYVTRIAAERIDAAHKKATLRSGKRGKIARGVALESRNMEKSLKAELWADRTDAQVSAFVLETLYTELEAIDAHGAEARARSILASLGIDEKSQDAPVSTFSGGWRMRVAVAQALFVEPDLLLLDECTNHLDLAAIAWLQDYITTLDVTIVCVSHDRDFLNGVSQEIIRLKDKQLSYHPGNYDEFEQAEDELKKKRDRQHAALEKRREHVKASLQKMEKHARQHGDDKVLNQVASRGKKLERMAGIDKTEDGKRFKVSYWAGFHDTMRPEIELIEPEKGVDFKLPQPNPLRSIGPIVALHSVNFKYPGKKSRTLRSIELSIMQGDHIAVVGLNGSGKSTLVQLLNGTLHPSAGRVEVLPQLKVGHYTQHFVDELSNVADCAVTLLRDRITASAPPHCTPPKEGDLRRWLGSFEVSGNLATRPVHTLSGGQRARLAMALMLWERPHLLLLDEITNHLDMYAVQGLVTAINEYEGAVVLVTHDRHFVREAADAVYTMEEGRLKRLEGGIDEYVAKLEG